MMILAKSITKGCRLDKYKSRGVEGQFSVHCTVWCSRYMLILSDAEAVDCPADSRYSNVARGAFGSVSDCVLQSTLCMPKLHCDQGIEFVTFVHRAVCSVNTVLKKN